MSTHQLAEFQSAAVDHIVSRLRDRRGSQRFLLADEVGLGKTIVAKGVIRKMAEKRRGGLRVVYLCSNSEIAEQNRSKLVVGGGVAVGRVTELVTAKPRPDDEGISFYAFTPGTSLAGGTGMAWERQLMLFLLHRAFGFDVDTAEWREFFRCNAGVDRWEREARWSTLHSRYLFKVSTAFTDGLRDAVAEVPARDRIHLKLLSAADAYKNSDRARRERNKLIGTFRGVVQRVALATLNPDLVILDEVQRFKDVIDNAKDKTKIASQLFAQRAPVLILSATPYRFFTPEQEIQDVGTSHHEDFFKTLEFLFDDDTRTPKRIQRNLDAFGRGLGNLDLAKPKDDRLVGLKREIERDLRSVVCRTERNWYFQDLSHKAADAGPKAGHLPGRDELREFFDIHRGVAAHVDCSALVTDFWKSSPSLLTFVDAKYALMKRLVASKRAVPRSLLSAANDPGLSARNLRLKHVVGHALGTESKKPLLWLKPTYTYHADVAYGDEEPAKMLVFSGWRFVPKAVAVVVSNAAAARLPRSAKERRQPLRFTEKPSFHVFDACCPVWCLAEHIRVRPEAAGDVHRSSDQLLKSAIAQLKVLLRDASVDITPVSHDPLWRVVARLESRTGNSARVRAMLSDWPDSGDVSDEYAERDRDQYLEWMRDASEPVSISDRQIRHLALIAIASPAVALLRALLSQFPLDEVLKAGASLPNVCFEQLRTYLNRPLQQQAIRSHRPSIARPRGSRRAGFAEKVLAYSLDHHLQAVLDEDVYLQHHAGGKDNVAQLLKHFTAAWSLSRGSRRTNAPRGAGTHVRIRQDADSWPIHFALAFGEDADAERSTTEAGDAEKRLRRSDVREAFNSPFWPFVLATTSVGQEGLDFHLYCKDVFHWNLPSNPVDLEQREGRINRRDCLAIRRSIASDWPLSRLDDQLKSPGNNPWASVFRAIEEDRGRHRFKHGLSPHWVYECADNATTSRVTRHVAFFDASRDAHRYRRLQAGLALYRLVFGQASQEHLLGNIERRLEGLDVEDRVKAQRRLAGYMLNLSPVGAAEAMKIAADESDRVVTSEAELRSLLDDVEEIAEVHRDELKGALPEITTLCTIVRKAIGSGDRGHSVRKAVMALCYLRNPYDQFFDASVVGGFDDDIQVLKRAVRRRSPPSRTISLD